MQPAVLLRTSKAHNPNRPAGMIAEHGHGARHTQEENLHERSADECPGPCDGLLRKVWGESCCRSVTKLSKTCHCNEISGAQIEEVVLLNLVQSCGGEQSCYVRAVLARSYAP